MSHDVDLTDISDLYEESLSKHGLAAPGVGWPDDVSHILRFDKLAYILPREATESFSINDLGCGYGAFYDYLTDRGYSLDYFRGYDVSEQMIAEARKHVTADNTAFIVGPSLTEIADYSFASGIFNVRLENNESKWMEYILETLDNLNNFSNKGFSFNLLSSHVDYHEPHLFYAEPAQFFDYCVKNFSRHVALLHDYPLFEWTIGVIKE